MRRAWTSLLACCAVALGCGGESPSSGIEEPLRVSNAAWKNGELPGVDAKHDDARKPLVTAIQSGGAGVKPGQVGKKVTGRTSGEAYAVALRLADLGTGYWVKPVGAEDAITPGELTWEAFIDIGRDVEPGKHDLEVVAIDSKGHAGTRALYHLCVTPAYDNTLNACDPTVKPPAAVISLQWDVEADVDLVVRTPSGKVVDARHPSTVESEDDTPPDPTAAGVGLLGADSNPECEIDSAQRENLIWQTAPEPGTYLVYANLFEACGRSAVQFEVSALARARGERPDTYRLAEVQAPVFGELLGGSANGGAKKGLYVTQVQFP